MPIQIEQAIYSNARGGGFRFLARSPGFGDDWLAEAERLCTGFGERPAGVACPQAVFAQPFGPRHAAIVQAADQGVDEAGRPGAIAFRLLVLPMKEYTTRIGDPFAIADRFPPDWSARELPAVEWPDEPLPRRLADATQQILKNGDSPTLLGGVQALVDGGRMVYERPCPAPELVRGIWALLPHSTRAYLWPATFAFGRELDFHLLVVPQATPRDYAGYLTEEQAGDYPQGHYELELQIAAESGDQQQLDRLFERRSSTETIKLALILIVVMSILALVSNLAQRVLHGPRAEAVAARPAPPLKEKYPQVDESKRKELTAALRKAAARLNVQPLPDPPTAEALLIAIDQRLGTPPERNPGPLDQQGDLERRLRVLLWKQQVPRFDDEQLNVLELAEKLQERIGGNELK